MMRLLAVLAFAAAAGATQAQSRGNAPLQLQILGSGGADPSGNRAGAAALIWSEGKARVLIDVGPGAAMRLTQAEANLADLDAVLLSHLRTERTADLPTLIGSAGADKRPRSLPVYGPAGNRWMPSTVTFVRTLFDPTRGAWRHLGEVLSPLERKSFKLEPHDLRPRPSKLGVPRDDRDEPLVVAAGERLRINALPLTVGPTPMLLWRVEVAGKSVIVIPEIGAPSEAVQRFAQAADVLMASIATGADSAALVAQVARLAQAAKVKQLVLGAGVAPTFVQEEEISASIRRHYHGAIEFVNDLDCLTP